MGQSKGNISLSGVQGDVSGLAAAGETSNPYRGSDRSHQRQSHQHY